MGNLRARLKAAWRAFSSKVESPAELQQMEFAFWSGILQPGNGAEPENQGLPATELNALGNALRSLEPEALGALSELTSVRGKSRGAFYTPVWMADYLVRRTLGVFLDDRRDLLARASNAGDWETSRQVIEHVRSLRVCDPACGAGVFLLKALRLLHGFYQDAKTCLEARSLPDTEALTGLLPPHSARFVVERQLHGVDLNPVAVLLTQWSLATLAAALDGEVDEISVPISTATLLVGDALELEAGGFTWDRCFPEVSRTGWDYLFGNPPYLTEVRDQSALFRRLKAGTEREGSRLAGAYTAKMDLCDAFLALGLSLLKPGGTLAYVMPEYWTQRESSRPLRRRMWKTAEISELWTFGDGVCFPRAPGHHTSLVILHKSPVEKAVEDNPPGHSRSLQWGIGRPGCLDSEDLVSAGLLLQPGSEKFLWGSRLEISVLEKIARLSDRAFETKEIQQGIVFPQGRLRKADWERLPPEARARLSPDAGIFILTPEEADALGLSDMEAALLRPYRVPAGFQSFHGFPVASRPENLLYVEARAKRAILEKPGEYPNIRWHLDRFAPILTSAHAPYGLHRPRQPQWFEDGGKILSLRQAALPSFARVPEPVYVNESFYVLRSVRFADCPDFLAGVLNSRLAWFWFHKQKRKGDRLQVDKDVLLSFPLPSPLDTGWVTEIARIAESLRAADPARDREAIHEWRLRLDALVYRGYGLLAEEIVAVENLSPHRRISEKAKSLTSGDLSSALI